MNSLPRIRLLVIPGLHDSGPDHWQTWLENSTPGALRVEQRDWAEPDLDEWSRRVASTIERQRHTVWLAAAHSFGCLALARYLQRGGQGIVGALFVAPADPDKFGVASLLPSGPLPMPSALIGSETDPWMTPDKAGAWAATWGARFVNLGDAGHINAASGHGPLPRAKLLLEKMRQRVERQRRQDGLGESENAVAARTPPLLPAQAAVSARGAATPAAAPR